MSAPVTRHTEHANGPRVLVADDHPLWRETLVDRLQHGGCTVVGVFEDGRAAVDACDSVACDVALLDVDMPVLDGIDATAAIVRRHPVRVLILSGVTDPDRVRAAVQAGASGYVLKTASGAEIRQAVERVHAGQMVLSPEVAAAVIDERNRGEASTSRSPLTALTSREREVLALMAEGHSNQAIAGSLVVSGKTVESHVAAIFRKLGMPATDDQHRRVAAVLTYLTHQPEVPA